MKIYIFLVIFLQITSLQCLVLNTFYQRHGKFLFIVRLSICHFKRKNNLWTFNIFLVKKSMKKEDVNIFSIRDFESNNMLNINTRVICIGFCTTGAILEEWNIFEWHIFYLEYSSLDDTDTEVKKKGKLIISGYIFQHKSTSFNKRFYNRRIVFYVSFLIFVVPPRLAFYGNSKVLCEMCESLMQQRHGNLFSTSRCSQYCSQPSLRPIHPPTAYANVSSWNLHLHLIVSWITIPFMS